MLSPFFPESNVVQFVDSSISFWSSIFPCAGTRLPFYFPEDEDDDDIYSIVFSTVDRGNQQSRRFITASHSRRLVSSRSHPVGCDVKKKSATPSCRAVVYSNMHTARHQIHRTDGRHWRSIQQPNRIDDYTHIRKILSYTQYYQEQQSSRECRAAWDCPICHGLFFFRLFPHNTQQH